MTLILVLGLQAAQFASLLLHLQEHAEMLAEGHLHSGMPALDALPLRFIWHVSLTWAAVIIVSLVDVRWATRPLQQMASAATAFAHDPDAAPLPVSGPTEVRRAAEAFNFMKHRLRQRVVERGRALAAVAHDLRTPLARMRLRAEMVDDPGRGFRKPTCPESPSPSFGWTRTTAGSSSWRTEAAAVCVRCWICRAPSDHAVAAMRDMGR